MKEESFHFSPLCIIDIPDMPCEQDYIICNIDVLGSKDYVVSKDNKALYEKIYDAYRRRVYKAFKIFLIYYCNFLARMLY